MTPDVWTVEETADWLKVSTEQVWKYVYRPVNPLPCHPLSPKVFRFIPSEVTLWVQSHNGDVTEGRAIPSQENSQRDKGVRVRSNSGPSRPRGRTETQDKDGDFRAAIDAITK